MIIDNVVVEADETVFRKDELKNYVEETKKKFPSDEVKKIRVTLCTDGKADVNFTVHGQPFERIRRITGYLTGDLNSWNNAKRAEESERVKHGVVIMIENICQQCGKIFQVPFFMGTQKFCSEKCKKKYRRENREKMAQYQHEYYLT